MVPKTFFLNACRKHSNLLIKSTLKESEGYVSLKRKNVLTGKDLGIILDIFSDFVFTL